MNCKQGALQLIDQIIEVIGMVPHGHYAQPMDVFSGSTLGKHFRHIYDFFLCLSEQCDDKEIDYASRSRNPEIEEDPFYAIERFRAIQRDLGNLEESTSLSVYADFSLPDGTRPSVSTTIGRELMYAYDHSVHHLAIVKIGLREIDPALPLSRDIGVAASTIAHQYVSAHGHGS